MLSILPVSAFADAGAGPSSAAAEETNSITYSSQRDYEDVGTNAETQNQVVKIKFGDAGLPKAAAGTGWSYTDAGKMLTINGVANANTEYILDGTVNCTVFLNNVSGATVYLLDGTVEGTLRVAASSLTGVYVLGGSYANVELYTGTVEGGTYDKLVQNGGEIKGGFFRDITGLKPDTQQQAHKLILPENCTLNGRKETGDIYIVKPIDYSGTGRNLKLAVESNTSCEGWAVATTSDNGGVMTLPAGVTDYNFTRNGNVIAIVSISEDGRELSASFGAIPGNAPMKLVTIQSMSKELRFTNEGVPDVTDVACVESLDEGENKCQAYLCRNWTYVYYPELSNPRGILMMADQGGREINFKALSPAPINCAVQLTNATITDAAFGEKGALALTSGKITGGVYPDASVGAGTIGDTGKVEITGGVFDSLSCYGECTISNAVILDCMFSTFFDNGKFTVSNTVFGALPDDLEGALAAGQQISKLVVRNGNVTAINGRSLTLSVNTIYLVGAGTADITLDTDVLSINDDAVANYNANTSAKGKVLHITGNNDGKDILVNKSTDVGAVKPLRITEKGLPDLTGVEPQKIINGGMEITLYEGLGWKYATRTYKEKGEDGTQITESLILITSPDGSPVDLTSREINPSQAALKSNGITLENVTVTSMYADAPVELNNAVIKSGYFQKEVSLDDTSAITGGVFDATVKLRDNAKITAGVFHDIKLPDHASEAAVIKNAVILGSLTGNHSKAAVSDTVSLSPIDSAYLAAGQQQSKLRSMDGVVTEVNSNPVADATAVYCIGEAGMVLTFSKPVKDINGKPVSAYAGAYLSADGKTLTLNGRNDGTDIVVNQTGETTEKLPFEGFTARDFRAAENEDGTYTLTCNKEGVGKEDIGKLTFECKYITGENAGKALPVNTYPTQGAPYGRYQVVITAEEGEKYKAGSIVVSEGVVRYAPVAADFSYDAAQNKVTYKGENYYDADPTQMILMYAPEGTKNYNTAVPTAPGRYDVYVMVYEDANYYNSLTEKVGTFVVAGTSKPTFTVTVYGETTEIKEYAEDEEVSITAPKLDGYTFTEWYAGGVPAGTVTTNETITFKMPANNVTLEPLYKETTVPAQKYLLHVDKKVTEHVEGEEISVTAPEKKGYTPRWEADGVPAGTDLTGKTVTFKMPANDVYLYLDYDVIATQKYTLTVKDENGENSRVEQHEADELIQTIIAPEKYGYTFTGWKVEGQLPDGTDTSSAMLSFRMPANDVTLTPQYAKKYSVTVNGVKQGSYFERDDVTIEAPKYEGLTFAGWVHTEGLPDGTDTTGDTITFKMPANDVTVYANLIPTPPTPEPDPEPKTYELKVTGAKVTLKQDGSEVTDLTAVPVGTELVATADADTDTSVFKKWNCTGLELTEEQSTNRVLEFTMPDHDMDLVAEFVTPTNKLEVTNAKVTLKQDGSEVTDLTAVPVGTELVATADADTDTSVFKKWNCTGLELTEEQSTNRVLEFTMPDHDVDLMAEFEVPAPTPDPNPDPDPNPNPNPDPNPDPNPNPNPDPTPTPTPDPDPAPAPSDDGSAAVIVAATAVGGAAVGVGAYMVGTTVYLKSVLPEGMAIPANRQQLAVALWTAAGKPATQSTALFNDVAADAAELQAIRWAVDTGLMSAQDGSFNPGSRVSRWEVIRTWKNYQKRG